MPAACVKLKLIATHPPAGGSAWSIWILLQHYYHISKGTDCMGACSPLDTSTSMYVAVVARDAEGKKSWLCDRSAPDVLLPLVRGCRSKGLSTSFEFSQIREQPPRSSGSFSTHHSLLPTNGNKRDLTASQVAKVCPFISVQMIDSPSNQPVQLSIHPNHHQKNKTHYILSRSRPKTTALNL